MTLHGRNIQAMFRKSGSVFKSVKNDPANKVGPQTEGKKAFTNDKNQKDNEKKSQSEGKKKKKGLHAEGKKDQQSNPKKAPEVVNKPFEVKKGLQSENKQKGKKNLQLSVKEEVQAEGKKNMKKQKKIVREAMEVDEVEFTPQKQQNSQKFGGASPGKRKFSGESLGSPQKKQRFDGPPKNKKLGGPQKQQKDKKKKFKKPF